MKRIKFIVQLLLLAIALPSYSQLSQKIEEVNMSSAHKYQGKKYLYYNFFTYDGTQSLPPMPFQGDRIRDGKYKASATAMNNYIEEFKKNSGRTYTFVKFFPDPQYAGLTGAVFASETGDTVYVGYQGINEFLSVEYLETEKKNIGKKLYETDFSSVLSNIKDNPNAIPTFFTYSDAKTKELKPSFLPFLSEWTIRDVNYDTTYYGEHTVFNDAINMTYNRLYYIIENKKYGSFICFYDEKKHTLSKETAYWKVLPRMLRGQYDYQNYNEDDLKVLETWAKEGTADMKYFYFAITEYVKKNNGGNEVTKNMVKFAEEGSLAACYELASTHKLDKIPFEKMCNIIKKVCQPVERNLIYSEIFRKTGNYAESLFPLADSKTKLDEYNMKAKEMYKLAEECSSVPMDKEMKDLDAKYTRFLQKIQESSNNN